MIVLLAADEQIIRADLAVLVSALTLLVNAHLILRVLMTQTSCTKHGMLRRSTYSLDVLSTALAESFGELCSLAVPEDINLGLIIMSIV